MPHKLPNIKPNRTPRNTAQLCAPDREYTTRTAVPHNTRATRASVSRGSASQSFRRISMLPNADRFSLGHFAQSHTHARFACAQSHTHTHQQHKHAHTKTKPRARALGHICASAAHTRPRPHIHCARRKMSILPNKCVNAWRAGAPKQSSQQQQIASRQPQAERRRHMLHTER